MIKSRVVEGDVNWAKGRSTIDWSELTDGESRHFTGVENARTFQASAHTASRRYGMKARTTVADGGIYVQFYQED